MQISRCPLDRLGEVQAFIDTHWRAGHILSRDAELLRWQHRAEGSKLAILIATDGTVIRGMLGLIPVAFNLRGRKLPGNWLALWATAKDSPPALGVQLLGAAMRSGEFTGVLGANEAAMKVYRGLRWAAIDAVPRWIRIGSSDALQKLLGEQGHRADDVPTAQRATAHTSTPSIVDATPQLLSAWDEAWTGRFAARMTGTWRDGSYLQWRYLDHPRFKYTTRFAVDAAGRIDGCLVYRVIEVPDRATCVVRAVEFIADGSAAGALAADLAQAADEADAAFTDFYCTASDVGGTLTEVGFVEEAAVGTAIPSLLQPIDLSRTRLTAALHVASNVLSESTQLLSGELYLTRSDGDQDRPN